MKIVKQNQFKNLGELHKEWSEAGVKASRAPHTDVSRNLATVVVRGVLPGLRRRTGLLPSGPKSSFQMRASFVFHLETKVLESGRRVEKSSVKFPQSVMIWGAMSSAGVGPLFFFFLNQRLCTHLTRNLSTSCFLLQTSFLIKRTKDLNYFSLCALNVFNTQVSQFELNYWNKWTFPRHSNLLRCTCIYIYIYIKWFSMYKHFYKLYTVFYILISLS